MSGLKNSSGLLLSGRPDDAAAAAVAAAVEENGIICGGDDGEDAEDGEAMGEADRGQFREQRAVKVIQRYYRGYRLRRDFERMSTDKRCSKRLDLGLLQSTPVVDAAATATSDMSDSAVDVTIDDAASAQRKQAKQKQQQHRHNSLDDILVGNEEAFLAWQQSLQPLGAAGNGGVSSVGVSGGDGDGGSPGQDSGVHSSEQLSTAAAAAAAAAASTPTRPPVVKRCHSCSAAAAAAAATSVQQQQQQQSPSLALLSSPPQQQHHQAASVASAPAAASKTGRSATGAVAMGNGGQQQQQALVSSCRQHQQAQPPASYAHYGHNDRVRKRTYRIGLNFFNRKPDKGIQFLVGHHFIQNSPSAVARFLLHRKGLCKQVISNYLGQCHASTFVNRVCDHFLNDFDFTTKPLDIALREFLQFIEIKGEAQVVSRILEKFANRYIHCNSGWIAEKFQDSDVIHLLVFAVIMLNTDLHNMNNKRKITLREFVHNLRGCDSGSDLADTQMLADLYERIRAEPLRAGSDHVTQVLKMEAQLYGRHPPLAEPHRRLVCFCKLALVKDWKGPKPRSSERAVFLFNDLLIVTKCLERKRRVFYQYKGSLGLHRMQVSFSVPDRLQVSYPIHIIADPEGCNLDNSSSGGGGSSDSQHDLVFSARNFHDRSRFCDDLVESIHEVGDMSRYERGLFAEPQQVSQQHQRQRQHQRQHQHSDRRPACHHPQPQPQQQQQQQQSKRSTKSRTSASASAE